MACRLHSAQRRQFQPQRFEITFMSMFFDLRIARFLFLSTMLFGIGTLYQPSHAKAQSPDDRPAATKNVVIELFYRSDSDQSLKSKQFLEELQKRRPGIDVKAYDLLNDKPQLKRMLELTKQFGHEKPGLPSIYLCNTLQLGFRDAQSTGAQIEDLLTINAYIRPGCKHCKAGKKFLNSMVLRYPAVRVVYHDVIADVNARNEVQQLANLYRVQIPSFPCIRAAGRLFVGYQTDEISGSRIEDLFVDRSVDLTKVEKKNSKITDESNKAGATGADDNQQTSLEPDKAQPIPLTGVGLDWLAPLSQPTLISCLSFQSSDSVPVVDAKQDPLKQQPEQEPDEIPVPDELEIPDDVSIPDDVALPGDVPLSNDDQAYAIVIDSGSTRDVDPENVHVPVFGSLSVSKLGMPAFTFLIGLVDGFNPCAMWVLVFLLSVLVNIKERKKILIVAGTFVIVSGLAYFTFMAAWFNVFQLIGLLRPVQIGLGVMAIVVGAINIKDFFAFHKGVTLSIPEASKPGIYKRVRKIVAAKHLSTALFAAVVLAVVVNIVELLCTAGLPALYTQVLTMQELPTWANYSYLGLYILAYMLDDTILVGIVVLTLSHRRLQESEGRWLKLLSGVVILLLGAVMILFPEALV